MTATFRLRPAFLTGVALLFVAGALNAQTTGAQTKSAYVEHTGEKTNDLTFVESANASGWLLISTGSNRDVHTLRLAKSLETISWRYQSPERNLDYTATKEGDIIHIVGTLAGNSVDTSLDVPGLPWYQALEKSLEQFSSDAGRQSVRFWIVEPFELKPLRMIAVKQGVESVTLADNSTCAAMKVDVTFDGVLSLFWHSTYWYRVSDNRFVKYAGARGGPGTPTTYVVALHQ